MGFDCLPVLERRYRQRGKENGGGKEQREEKKVKIFGRAGSENCERETPQVPGNFRLLPIFFPFYYICIAIMVNSPFF